MMIAELGKILMVILLWYVKYFVVVFFASAVVIIVLLWRGEKTKKNQAYFTFDTNPQKNNKQKSLKNSCPFYIGNKESGNCNSCYKKKGCLARIKQIAV